MRLQGMSPNEKNTNNMNAAKDLRNSLKGNQSNNVRPLATNVVIISKLSYHFKTFIILNTTDCWIR